MSNVQMQLGADPQDELDLKGRACPVGEAKTRQESHKWNKQVATQEMKAALGSAQNAAIQIQSAAKFKLGARSEALVAFQVKPLRKRGPRKSAQLKAQEAENERLKKQVELLKMKDEPAAAS